MPFDLVNKEQLKEMGYADQINDIENGICPHCKKKVDVNSFTSAFYRVEFELCGYCEDCTREARSGVRKNVEAKTCFRCGEPVSMASLTVSERDIYYKMAVCANCQRKLEELSKRIMDL